MMMAADPAQMALLKGQFRVVSSAGEPLNPEVIRWFKQVLDAPIYDHYGQTEVGMVVCNHHGLSHEIRAGAAGFPSPVIGLPWSMSKAKSFRQTPLEF